MLIEATYYDRRLTVQVPSDFGDAVRTAADRHGLTLADYARDALADRLARDGVPFERPPLLHRLARPPGETTSIG